MEFKFKLEDIAFYVELREDPDFKPQQKAPLNSDYTLDDLKNGEFNFYSLFIISKKAYLVKNTKDCSLNLI